VINFRVTDEEFARLKTASEELGSRCLSDFARTVILRSARDAGRERPPAPEDPSRVDNLEQRLTLLEAHLMRVERTLGARRAAAAEAAR
jgi:hypothetical protein